MLSVYPACFLEEANGYSVMFPDFGCATCGETQDEAMAMAIDLLAGLVWSAQRDGDSLPAPSQLTSVSLDAVAAELEVEAGQNSFVTLVSVDASEYARTHFCKSVKKTLSIPSWLNQLAEEKGVNFSRVLQNALKQELGVQ